MKTVKGNGVSIGTTVGPVFIYKNEIDLSIAAKYSFSSSIKKLTDKFNLEIDELKGSERQEEAEILDAYILIMQDPEIIDSIVEKKEKSTSDVFEVFKSNSEVLADMDDEYFSQRAEDILSVGKHLIKTMQGVEDSDKLEEDSILVASDLTPADTSSMNMSFVKGIVLKYGGATSHAVIVAKNLGIPCVIGLGQEIDSIQEQDTVAIDGELGEVNINPNKETINIINQTKRFHKEINKKFTKQLYESSDIEFRVNIGSNEEIDRFEHPFLNSIGLFRSEFIYLDRNNIPTVEDQKLILEKIEKKFSGNIVYRTLDIGGDKIVSYLDLPHEENPFLGVRGIRLSLTNKELFESQIESILTSKNIERIKIMFPMVSTIEDFIESNLIVEKIAKKLKVKKPDIGIMIETPSSTLLVEEFANYVDFFSIGTNDLTQYIMAADRGNPKLMKYQDPLHPAILKAIDKVIYVSNQKNVEVSVCGEMASDALSAAVLYILGLRVFSMSSASAPFVFEKINQIKSMDIEELRKEILSSQSAGDVRDKLDKINL